MVLVTEPIINQVYYVGVNIESLLMFVYLHMLLMLALSHSGIFSTAVPIIAGNKEVKVDAF